MSGNVGVSSFSTFSVEAWASYSGDFGFSSFVLVDFPPPFPAGAFCQTETVCVVFPATSPNNFDVSEEACLRNFGIPFNGDSVEMLYFETKTEFSMVKRILNVFCHDPIG
ncbi:MAG: hypothetical protein LBE12_20210 [Planctomycetaceae bacterium]|nr:hypothetical protein [Planctomycetaceae bacterium]